MATTITFPANLTPRAEKALRQASEEAKRMGAEGFIGVEHIFLAILADQRAIPTQVMKKLGVVSDLRHEVEAILSSDGYRESVRRRAAALGVTPEVAGTDKSVTSGGKRHPSASTSLPAGQRMRESLRSARTLPRCGSSAAASPAGAFPQSPTNKRL